MIIKQDLRTFLKKIAENNNIIHISEEVKKEFEIRQVMMDLEKKEFYPVLIFNNIEENEFPVITNILGTMERFAEVMGVES